MEIVQLNSIIQRPEEINNVSGFCNERTDRVRNQKKDYHNYPIRQQEVR